MYKRKYYISPRSSICVIFAVCCLIEHIYNSIYILCVTLYNVQYIYLHIYMCVCTANVAKASLVYYKVL